MVWKETNNFGRVEKVASKDDNEKHPTLGGKNPDELHTKCPHCGEKIPKQDFTEGSAAA